MREGALNGSATTPPLESSMLEARAHVPEHVVFRSFVHETVMLNLQTGRYHGLNPTGGRMLELLAGGRSVSEAAAELADEYGRPVEHVERDVRAFCADLLERGLIVLSCNGRH